MDLSRYPIWRDVKVERNIVLNSTKRGTANVFIVVEKFPTFWKCEFYAKTKHKTIYGNIFQYRSVFHEDEKACSLTYTG